jgi:hypothetical protein
MSPLAVPFSPPSPPAAREAVWQATRRTPPAQRAAPQVPARQAAMTLEQAIAYTLSVEVENLCAMASPAMRLSPPFSRPIH